MNKKIFVTFFLVVIVAFQCVAQKTYTNPVFRADFPDPSVQRGLDGYFYAYATGPNCLKSKDLVTWQGVSRVIDRPTWNDSTYVDSQGNKKTDYYSFWACDVSRVENKYVMYYACALWGNGSRTGIGVATGDALSKFTDKGKMFRSTEIGVENSIDPVYWEEKDKKYLAWGSFNGIYISELTEDGLKLKNPSNKTMIAGTAFEGAMIHKRGNYYYLICSVGSCCDGVNSTYHAVVGRSTKLMGPYVDKNGGKMLDNRYTTIIKANSRWRAPGHNSEIITDDNGDDWLLYHAIDTEAPDDGRMMLLDKIVWDADGWPSVNDGTPSTTPQPAPVFYDGDGANMGYLFRNLNMSNSAFKHWTVTKSDDCTPSSGSGATYYNFGYVNNSGTFDISQTATGVPNGLYELRMDAFDTHYNVAAYVNGTEELVHNATQPEEIPATVASISSQFNRGNFERSFYGLVVDGTLKIGMRSVAPLVDGEKFYLGNVRVIYRDKNATALAAVLSDCYAKAEAATGGNRKFYKGYGTAVNEYRAIAEASSDDSVRYAQLLAIHNTIDSIAVSAELYDSLAVAIEWMDGELKRATEEGYCSDAARAVLDDARTTYAQASGNNGKVTGLFLQMKESVYNMINSFQQGDGTAGNPYIISRPQQMMQMHSVLVKGEMVYFAMDKDVDMKGYEWTQLNTSDNAYGYRINFDGRGHIIRNLTPVVEKGYPSFFGTLCGECRNVGFVDACVSGEATGAAVLAGCLGNSSFKDAAGNHLPVIVENCYFTGSVTSRGYVGAVAGTVTSSPVTIRNVYTAVEVVGNGVNRNYCGGIVGRVTTSLTIENCYSAGTVKAPTAAPIAAGGQSSSTPASMYANVIAWNKAVDGVDAKSDVTSFAFTEEGDTLINTYSFSQMLLNGEAIDGGKSHSELQSIVASWGGAWHSNPAAGNGYPILQWQYERGDYREICGFSQTNDISPVNAPEGTADAIYDLNGRKTDKAVRGIYIINGVKRLFK